jgi:hypothetical protein
VRLRRAALLLIALLGSLVAVDPLAVPGDRWGALVPLAARAQADTSSSMVDNFEAARSRRDIEAVLAFFTDDATVRDRSGREHVGRDQIRQFLLLTASRGRTTAVGVHDVGANRVAWTERVTTQISNLEFNVEAVVQDGKIKALIYGEGGQAGRVEALTDTSGALPAFLGLGAVAVVLSAGLATVSLGLPRRDLGTSALQGQLVAGLHEWATTRRRPMA